MKILKFIAAIPKPETHLHLEGTIRPQTLYDLAQEYHEPLPYSSPDEVRKALQMRHGDNLLVFLKKVAAVHFLFAHPEAIRRVAYEAIEDASQSNVKYVELQVNPDKPAGHLSSSRILRETVKGAREAGKKYGVKVYVVAQINRGYSVESGWRVARAAVNNYKHRGGVVALSLAADEAHYPPDKFKEVFKWAKSQGLKIVIHAGEAAGASSIRKALECGADAIDHGTTLQEDPALEKEMAEKKISLRMCFSSNYITKVISSMRAFPFKRYLTSGIPATLGRDDPAFFGGISLNHEYQKVFLKNELTVKQLQEIALNGFRYSFAPPRVKRALIRMAEKTMNSLSISSNQRQAG